MMSSSPTLTSRNTDVMENQTDTGHVRNDQEISNVEVIGNETTDVTNDQATVAVVEDSCNERC